MLIEHDDAMYIYPLTSSWKYTHLVSLQKCRNKQPSRMYFYAENVTGILVSFSYKNIVVVTYFLIKREKNGCVTFSRYVLSVVEFSHHFCSLMVLVLSLLRMSCSFR